MKLAIHQRIKILYDFTYHRNLDKFTDTEREVSVRSWEGTVYEKYRVNFSRHKVFCGW